MMCSKPPKTNIHPKMNDLSVLTLYGAVFYIYFDRSLSFASSFFFFFLSSCLFVLASNKMQMLQATEKKLKKQFFLDGLLLFVAVAAAAVVFTISFVVPFVVGR